MGDISIKGRSARANYRHGGSSIGSNIRALSRKLPRIIKGMVARKEAKKTQDAKDKIQKSEMGYKKGGKV